jgi:hypothetical protein
MLGTNARCSGFSTISSLKSRDATFEWRHLREVLRPTEGLRMTEHGMDDKAWDVQ